MPKFFGNNYNNIGTTEKPIYRSALSGGASGSSSNNVFTTNWKKSDDFQNLAEAGAILSFNHPMGDNIHLSRIGLQNGILIDGIRYTTHLCLNAEAINNKVVSFELPNWTSIDWYKTDILTGKLESMSNYLYETDWRLFIVNPFGSDFDGAGLDHIDENAFAFTTSLSFVNGQSGTWQVPQDVVSATVSLIGGGGAGAVRLAGSNPSWYYDVEDSWNGGASTFSGNGVDMIANGGSHGQGGGAGGTASGGDINNTGESGTNYYHGYEYSWSSGKSSTKYIRYPGRDYTTQVETNGILPSQKLIATYEPSGFYTSPSVVTTVTQAAAGYGFGGAGAVSPIYGYSYRTQYQGYSHIGGAGGFTSKTFNVQEGQIYEFTSGAQGNGSYVVGRGGQGIVHISWETSNQN